MLLHLKIAIISSGQSQRQLARSCSIGEARMSSIVNGWVRPTEDERRRVSIALGIAENELF